MIETKDAAGIAKVITIVVTVSLIILLVGNLKSREAKNVKELIRLNDVLVFMATTDSLTGAMNRHAFLTAAKALYEDNRQFQNPLSVLFIDVDKFKQINDSFGHSFGDCVLARLSEIISECLQADDLSCRYGGEEFVVLLIHADCNAAKIVAEHILKEVRQAGFSGYPNFNFTVSIGISCGIPTGQNSLESWINNADNAMYQAKQAGRNNVVLNRLK